MEMTHTFSPDLSYSHGTSSTPLLTHTIGEALEEVAARFGGREALVDKPSGRRWTYAELDADVDVLAAGLLELGVEKGGRVRACGHRTAPGGRSSSRDRGNRRHPGQHQPCLPAGELESRSSSRAAAS